MITRCVLPVALLLCFSITALSRSFNLLQFQQRISNEECEKLLWTLKGTPESCLEDQMNFEVPEEIEQPEQLQREDAAWVICVMLQKISHIFTQNVSRTGWDETTIEDLLAELSQQVHHLQAVLPGDVKERNATGGKDRAIQRLDEYYSKIGQYLKAKDYSPCAWTVVHGEILRNFLFIRILTDYLQN
uniref:Interferon 1DA1 n=1 Tax=Procavia capensis TaxID=9813 RepID=A0A7R8GVB0_PROCA|nr:TPA: interferon 1DA1 [Procavia capensis]